MLRPKLFTTLSHYSKEKFFSDFTAGIIVGIVALPLAIAFGIASGVSPEKGLITAIIAGFFISALGGSRVQVGGPTGAFVVIVYGIVQKYGMDGLIIATMMAGVLLVIMGFARLGTVIKFIPHPVVVGFTSGIALIIFSSQIKDFLGLPVGSIPADFVEKWLVFSAHIQSFNPYALGITLGTVAIAAFWPKVSRKIPGSLVALVLSSAAVEIWNLPVETIGTRFGSLPHVFPVPGVPHLRWEMIRLLMKPALTIALLGAIESLLSAVVADGMIGGRHRSNMELIAQGTANIFSGFFGGIPATGAIARTATNVKNGGRTPVAGMVHAATVLVIVLFLGSWAKLIPLSCLAGILAVVAYHMSEWRSFISLLKGPRGGAVVLLATFLVTVLFDLTVAIEIGMVLSLMIFMHRMSRITHVRIVEEEVEEEEIDRKSQVSKIKVPQGVEVYEINGPFFFGASHKFEEAMRVVEKMPRVRILRLSYVPMIDSTGLYSLKGFFEKCRANHVELIIAGIRPQPLSALKKAGLYELIGEKNIFSGVRDALKRASEIMAPHDHPVSPAPLAKSSPSVV